MNYAIRFGYHIFGPACLIVTYIVATEKNTACYLSFEKKLRKLIKVEVEFNAIINIILVLWFIVFSAFMVSRMPLYIEGYPRALNSHAALGKTIKEISEKYNIVSYSFSEAGMAAYHSNLNVFDSIGLGSSYVVHKGVDLEILDMYKPDLAIFYLLATESTNINLNIFNYQIVYDWAIKHRYIEICDVYFNQTVMFKIFGKQAYPELLILCDKSKKANNVSYKEIFFRTAFLPPWYYWKE